MMIDKYKIITSDFDFPSGMIDLGIGQPGESLLPLTMLEQAARHCLTQDNPYLLAYGAEQGSEYFRIALAGLLSDKYQFRVDPGHLFTTTGSSQALDFICSLFTRAGDTIFVEEPTYSLALGIFADHHLNVVGVPTDENGVITDALEEALDRTLPVFFYTIPTFHNPSGSTLSRSRRKEIVALSRKYPFLIVADEVYQLLSYTGTPPSPMAGYCREAAVLSLGSFSKILAPGLRLGWIQARPDLIRRLSASGLVDSGGGLNPFTSAIVQSVIELGLQETQLSRLKKTYSQRKSILYTALTEHLPNTVSFTEPDGGFFIWLRLPAHVDTEKLLPQARRYNVGFSPGARFSPRQELKNHMRLSFAYYEDSDLVAAARRLGEVIRWGLTSVK
jgi:DNA-binding transcriptional MocR family regulator